MITIALLLGIVEGLTEFIPVSSTGHLILFGDLLGFEGPESAAFEIIIQLGAILAVCWHFRHTIFSTTRGVCKGNIPDVRFVIGLLIAFVPAMIAGALFHSTIKALLFNSTSVAIALIVGGIVILVVERIKPAPRYASQASMPLSLYFKIGLCQCVSLIPGTSRSGATIIGSLWLGVERKTATEFSFFLAIPTMLAATAFELYGSWNTLTLEGLHLIAVGFVTAFISALLVVRWLMGYVARHGFAPFAYYRIALGALMLILLY
jgi:undecaprenyl-diphosphatase